MILSSVKTTWISSLHDRHAFNQSDSNVIVAIVRYETVVYWFTRSLRGLMLKFLGLGNVKIVVVKGTVNVSFVQTLLWFFAVKGIKFAQTGNLHFDRR